MSACVIFFLPLTEHQTCNTILFNWGQNKMTKAQQQCCPNDVIICPVVTFIQKCYQGRLMLSCCASSSTQQAAQMRVVLVGTCHIYRFYEGITKEGSYSIVITEFLISFLCSNLMQVLDISQLRLVTLHIQKSRCSLPCIK